MNLSPEDVESKLSARTRVLLPVHQAGRPYNVNKIIGIANNHNLKMIEDCVHAVEAEH